MTRDNSTYDEVIADFEQLGIDFRINDINEDLEVHYNNKWRFFDDTLVDLIKVDLISLGYSITRGKPALSNVWSIAKARGHKQRYNPIKEYLSEQATRYQCQYNDQGEPSPYHALALGRYMTNPDEMFPFWLHRWTVGAVARVFSRERNAMLVLTGTQRIGKSSLAEWLCPIPDRFCSGGIKPDKKDHLFKQVDNFIWEVDELGSTTHRQDVEALKSFLTTKEIQERFPHAKRPIRKQCNASYMGTVNPDGKGFLNDPTGTTRFLCCEVNKINFDYSKEMSPHDIWAEATWFYLNVKDSWKLTPEEDHIRSELNAKYEVESALEAALHEAYVIDREGKNVMTSVQIKQGLMGYYKVTNETAFYNELRTVLARIGLKKARQGNRRGYQGIAPRPANER